MQKIIAIKQPWAWLIVNGYKDIENRTWKTKIRGEVLIHASKKFDQEAYDQLFYEVSKELWELMPEPHEYQKGGIVGKATITDCVEEHDSPWFKGKYGFILEDAQTLEFIPYHGQLGFFNFKEPRFREQKIKPSDMIAIEKDGIVKAIKPVQKVTEKLVIVNHRIFEPNAWLEGEYYYLQERSNRKKIRHRIATDSDFINKSSFDAKEVSAAQTELKKIAALLLTKGPSGDPQDYKFQKCTSKKDIQKMMSAADEQSKFQRQLAIRLNKVLNIF